jgi:hypothetical protein
MELSVLETFADEAAVRQRLELAELSGAVLGLETVDAAGGGLVNLAKTLLAEGAAPRLVAGVLAQALSRPAAVWWACRAAHAEHGGGVAEMERPALEAAEAWLRSPEQWRAYAANEAAKGIGLASPAGCAALAAFLAGESIGPSHLEPLPPQPQLAGMAAAAAVELAATRRIVGETADPWLPLLDIGFAIAAGADCWPQVNPTAATR